MVKYVFNINKNFLSKLFGFFFYFLSKLKFLKINNFICLQRQMIISSNDLANVENWFLSFLSGVNARKTSEKEIQSLILQLSPSSKTKDSDVRSTFCHFSSRHDLRVIFQREQSEFAQYISHVKLESRFRIWYEALENLNSSASKLFTNF